ncbi:hypothetical protein A5780_20145 [Nocardia sp. 852002-20019_SCH5090214]|nr:hypothetical protein A5780_20145 [Nocardia sp. 852002-20019_SCH5090214]
MECVKVRWSHCDPDEPEYFYSEIGKDRYETRKVQIYKDGHTDWATAASETGKAFLAEAPFPSIAEISSEPDIQAWEIRRQEFESAWESATGTDTTSFDASKPTEP